VWVFWGGFFGRLYPKKPPGFFWVCNRVSEPWIEHSSIQSLIHSLIITNQFDAVPLRQILTECSKIKQAYEV